jgi:hypothetical protein
MNEYETRAQKLADEMAAEMARKLQHSTPADMGWPDVTPEQLIEGERRCWLEDELRTYRLAGLLD